MLDASHKKMPRAHTKRLRAGGGATFRLAAALLLVALWGCSRWAPAPQDASQGLTLPQYLALTRDAQTFRLADLYTPPREVEETPDGTGRYGPGYVLLSPGPATLDLAENAADFQGFDTALAVGLADGDLRVYGTRSCTGVDQPVQGRPRNMAWAPLSRYLAVQGQARDRVFLYDVRRCELETVIQVPPPIAGVSGMAVSGSGRLLALAGPDGEVLTGVPGGELRVLARLGTPLLGLGFGQESALLFTVTPDGEITLLNTRTPPEGNPVMARFTARGGPFASARFQQRYIVLTTATGRRHAWDLQTRTQVPFSKKMAPFRIEERTLRYRTWNAVPHLTPYAGYPELRVRYCAASRVIQVLDLDGKVRLYSQDTGRLLATREPPGDSAPLPCGGGWTSVEVNEKGNFCLEDRCYVLTDRAFQWNHDLLLCRSVPGVGHFLWWQRSERPEQFSPLPDHLPDRHTILADEAVEWVPATPPREFP